MDIGGILALWELPFGIPSPFQSGAQLRALLVQHHCLPHSRGIPQCVTGNSPSLASFLREMSTLRQQWVLKPPLPWSRHPVFPAMRAPAPEPPTELPSATTVAPAPGRCQSKAGAGSWCSHTSGPGAAAENLGGFPPINSHRPHGANPSTGSGLSCERGRDGHRDLPHGTVGSQPGMG